LTRDSVPTTATYTIAIFNVRLTSTPAVPFALESAGIEFLDSNGVKLMAKPPKAESS